MRSRSHFIASVVQLALAFDHREQAQMLPVIFAASVASVTPAVQSMETCDVAVVGAGPGGIYFAWRLLAANSSASVCMYERSGRFGGRIYTLRGLGPKGDLTADMGAYRFVDKPTQDKQEGHGCSRARIEPAHLPMTAPL
jgi:NADPH-dependent 2,4-dienoyl-CoA reductase/sulfur reductase-like enzyme